MLTVLTYRLARENRLSKCHQIAFDGKMSKDWVKDWCQKKIDRARVWRIIDCTISYTQSLESPQYVLCYKRD